MDFQFQPGSSSLFSKSADASMGEKGDGEEARGYAGRGGGGKLRMSRRGSIKKSTPYDRPASGRHATAGGLPASSGAASASSSLTSRFVGSASRLIASSASYFFPSLFGQRNLALTNGDSGPVQGVIPEEQDEEEDLEAPTNEEIEQGPSQSKRDGSDSEQQLALVAVGAGIEKKELDLAQVEDMLKQKTWSREQVSRLTDLLKTRLIEHPPTVSRLAEAGVQADDTTVHAAEVTPRKSEENTATPISEAQRWREELKRARTDCAPVELARAFMGERTPSQSGLTRSFRGTAHQIDRVAELQPPPGLGLAEDRYRSFPVLRSWTRSPATQVPKRSPLLDEEWMSVGPVRRTRQKTFHMNSSPYARGLPSGDPVLPRTHVSPPVQSSQTARKILNTLEMLSPSPKSKFLNDEQTVATDIAPMAPTPGIFNIQGRRNMHRIDMSRFSSLRDISPSNGKLEFGSQGTSPTSTIGYAKESKFEDKGLVNRLLPNNTANFSSVPSGSFPKLSGISSSSSLLSSPAVNASLAQFSARVESTSGPAAASSASIKPESKSLFSFSLPSSTTESQRYIAESQHYMSSTLVGSPFGVPALSTFATSPAAAASPTVFTTSATNALFTAGAPSSISSPAGEQPSGNEGAATEGQLKGLDAMVKEPNKVSPPSFQFGSSSSGSPFSFQMGTNDAPFAAKGLNSAAGQESATGAQSESPFMTSSPFSKTAAAALIPTSMFGSSPASMSAMSSAAVGANAAVSGVPVLFGSQSSAFPLSKSSPPGQLSDTSSILKPAAIPPLKIEASSAPFTFSPPPALILCSTPSFSFGSTASASLSSSSSAGHVSVSCSVSISDVTLGSSAGDSDTGPVFSFTSPSGGPKLPNVAAEDTSLPVPTFNFGTGASPPSAELFAGSASSTTSFTLGGQLFGSGAGSSSLPNSLKLGGQATTGQLFGSVAGLASGPFSAAESLPAPAGVEAPASSVSGASGSEKAGRKFFKAKRRK
eukprot:c24447_g1_i1 orf=653-3619(+)